MTGPANGPLKVVLPLAMPAIAVLALFNHVAVERFFWPLIVLNRSEVYTLQAERLRGNSMCSGITYWR